MIYKVTYKKDVLGNNFLAIKFNENQIFKFLKDLKQHVGEEKYQRLVSNQQKRDRRDDYYTHHMTIVSTPEFNKAIDKYGSKIHDKLKTIFSLNITDLDMLGIGTASKNNNETYFIVCESPTLTEIRKSFGYDDKDFHITVGFDKKDVFGVRKNKVIEVKSDLKKLISDYQERYGNNYKFIYNIENLDSNLKGKTIEFISLTDTILTVIIENIQLQISIVDGKPRIVTKMEKTK